MELECIEQFNDIAILTLELPVKFTQTISPVCLPPQGTTDLYDGRLVFAKGLRKKEEKLPISCDMFPKESCTTPNVDKFSNPKITPTICCAHISLAKELVK